MSAYWDERLTSRTTPNDAAMLQRSPLRLIWFNVICICLRSPSNDWQSEVSECLTAGLNGLMTVSDKNKTLDNGVMSEVRHSGKYAAMELGSVAVYNIKWGVRRRASVTQLRHNIWMNPKKLSDWSAPSFPQVKCLDREGEETDSWTWSHPSHYTKPFVAASCCLSGLTVHYIKLNKIKQANMNGSEQDHEACNIFPWDGW